MTLYKTIQILIFAILLLFLTAILSHAADATFSWTANAETVSGYKIHYGTSSRNYTFAVDVGQPAAVNGSIVATVQGLQEGKTYYFAATAYSATEESDYSVEVVYTVPGAAPTVPPIATDTQAPSIPSGLFARATSSSQINLTWTASTDNIGVIGYKIYRGGAYIATSAGTSYTNTGLTASSSYSYQVSAKDAAGNESSKSSTASATTPAVAATPSPVTSVSLWDNTFTPAITAAADTAAVELGVKFQSEADGLITGLRFYKGTGNTGTHTGSLWTASGQLLASLTFANETASGWQYQSFSAPVPIAANTTYVASYHTNVGRYSSDLAYFSGSGFANSPLRALADGENGGNGVYLYGAGGFPDQTWNGTNYWVDVVFTPNSSSDSADETHLPTTPPAVTDTTAPARPSGLFASATSSSQINLAWTASTDNIGVTAYKIYRGGVYVAISTATSYSNTGLTASTSYRYQVSAIDAAGNESSKSYTVSATTQAETVPPSTVVSTSLWGDTFTPAVFADNDTAAVEVGVQFQSEVNGSIMGLRFYKGPGNTGTHTGSLWTASGQLLAKVTFANETTSGWQYQAFSTPVIIAANTTYVASYHTNVGRYSADVNYFDGSGFTNSPLRALGDGENGGNGIYLYGAGGFPNQTWNASNYWVDVVFTPTAEGTVDVPRPTIFRIISR